MKDFDQSYVAVDVDGDGNRVEYEVSRAERLRRERSFRIGGRDFTYRVAITPEAILPWSQMIGGELPDLTEQQALDIFDETVVAFLEPGQEEAWREVRKPDAPSPITLGDLKALVRWLFEEQTGRPTGPPSGSGGGRANGATGTSSRDESTSPVVAPV